MHVKAARLLSLWSHSQRKTVTVTIQEYKEILPSMPRELVVVLDEEPVYVVLDRKRAATYLEQQYGLTCTSKFSPKADKSVSTEPQETKTS